MARYSFSFSNVTPTATADTSTFGANTYALIQGGNATQRNSLYEIYFGGEAPSTSSPTFMVLARDSTVASATVSGGRVALLDGSGTAPATTAVTGTTTSGTQAQRSATLHLLHLSFNAYGGIVRWVAAPGSEIAVVGNTASLGEVSLSAFTGGTVGAISGHMLFETI
jgi:hypothetical protein